MESFDPNNQLLIAEENSDVSKRFGAAKGKFLLAEDWDINEGDEEIAELFNNSSIWPSD